MMIVLSLYVKVILHCLCLSTVAGGALPPESISFNRDQVQINTSFHPFIKIGQIFRITPKSPKVYLRDAKNPKYFLREHDTSRRHLIWKSVAIYPRSKPGDHEFTVIFLLNGIMT